MNPPENIHYLEERLKSIAIRSSLEKGGGPPYDGDMEARVAKLEAVLPHLATRADVEGVKAAIAESKLDLVKILLPALALAVGILIFVVNRASPPQQPVAQPQPIVIQVPAPPPIPAAPRKP